VTPALRVLVIGDSTAFTDHRGPQPPNAPHLYPNVLGAELEARLEREAAVTVVAQPGSGVREAWRAVTKDRHVLFDLLAPADAVVVAIGSFDHAPAGVPAALQALVPFVRPAPVRRAVRRGLHTAYPHLVRLRGGHGARTPFGEFARLYGLLLDHARSVTWGRAAGVALGPTSHRSPYYGHHHPGHARAETRQLALAARHGFATLAPWPLVEPHIDELNPDGIHWPVGVHAAVGRGLADALTPQLTGQRPGPGLPEATAAALARRTDERPPAAWRGRSSDRP